MSFKIIGLTGSTGSGKTAVGEYFVSKGFAFIETDKITADVHNDNEIKNNLVNTFGKEILDKNDKIIKKTLAAKAFINSTEQQKLNDITHPAIILKIKTQIEHLKKENNKGIIIDAPLLFESRCDSLCDLTLAVISTKENCLKRILKRDNLTLEEADMRLKIQKSDDYYKNHADKIITNDGTIKELFAQIDKVMKGWRI
jgi:dephospho-CoA kinase